MPLLWCSNEDFAFIDKKVLSYLFLQGNSGFSEFLVMNHCRRWRGWFIIIVLGRRCSGPPAFLSTRLVLTRTIESSACVGVSLEQEMLSDLF